MYGLLDRVGDALAEERERLELKAIEMTRRNNEQTVAGRHRMMRRADREVADPQQVEAIIATCKIVSLAYTDAEGITIVPLNFGYVFDTESNHLTLYFHGSATGRKMDAVKAAGNALPVAFEMATDCEVVEGRTLCNWGEAFKSIVGNGTASIIDNLDEARQGLALLMKQQAGRNMWSSPISRYAPSPYGRWKRTTSPPKCAKSPSRICTETPRRWCYHPRQKG